MDTSSLLIGIVAGAIGMGYVVYGRKQQRPVPLFAGLALCVYPYVIDGLVLTLLIGAVLIALPFVLRD